MKQLGECRLYTFIDCAYLQGRRPAELARQLCDGGSDLIQLRAKNLPREEVHRLAEELMPITEPAGVGLVINDYPEIARAVGAPVCHLGQEDFFEAGWTHVSAVRGESASLRVGLSSHAPAQAERAVAAGADYIAIGPVFATGTKPSAQPVTLDYVRWASTHLRIPWFAIGGITLQNLDQILEAGARNICVVSAILTAPDVAEACQRFKERLLSTASVNLYQIK